ncbi:MAG TPA: alpha/beta hydrolase [Chloroflexota bacterium]|nr:alpha/beta hydrolase [Chloroflexota bacterium]
MHPAVAAARLLAILALSAAAVPPASAQDAAVCQTPNGPRTSSQIADEVRTAGYTGPWDTASAAAAYARASGGPVTCPRPAIPGPRPLAVVFLAGYGSDLASAELVFEPLQAALTARNPNVAFVPYSYTGTGFTGCDASPSPYRPSDTAQDIELSKRILHDTLIALKQTCDVDRIAVVGHSLGGLIALQALGDQAVPGVTDLVTVDSPLGGVPLPLLRICIDSGFCADGPVVGYLAGLYAASAATTQDNAARVGTLAAAATRVTAWGNQSDCYYRVALCSAFVPRLLAALDARETQWAGMPRTFRKDFPFPAYVWNIPASHTAVLLNSATEMAADLLP